MENVTPIYGTTPLNCPCCGDRLQEADGFNIEEGMITEDSKKKKKTKQLINS